MVHVGEDQRERAFRGDRVVELGDEALAVGQPREIVGGGLREEPGVLRSTIRLA
jgi:hypothetical protein